MISRFFTIYSGKYHKKQRKSYKDIRYYKKIYIIMPHSIQKVFLTGANGFVACHILSDLIKVGTTTSVL
jgi:hypothetical protein